MQRWLHLRTQNGRQPVNRAVYECVRQSICDGGLPPSCRLPPSRDLASELKVSRNTVTHAYDQLLAEGYLRTLGGGGTFVADVVPEHVLWSEKGTTPQRDIALGSGDERHLAARLSRRGQSVVNGASASAVQWGAFVPGVPDVTEFPHRKFAQISARLWRKPAPQLLSYSSGGHVELKRELATHLRQARSVICDPDQIIITEGLHQAVDLITRVLGDPGDRVWMEEPGYWGIRSVLAINGMQVETVSVDAEGFAPEARHLCYPPKLIFVTPSHQYPLGCVMSLRRRLALLEYANQHSSWIVEDDYDSEFRFSGHPIPSLQGLVTDAPVIYLGTFSKSLYPGMRLAYMVLPRILAKSFLTAQSELYREGHLMTQAVLAEFIGAGHYAAHIRRMRLIYASRRTVLIGLVQKRLGLEWLHQLDSNAGLHLVLSLPDGLDDVEVAREALERGVAVRPLSGYYAGRPAESGLVLGFACVAERDMTPPFEILVECLTR
jgi:GntR family transcriptional regulator/MocR family aminotransferase